MEWLCETEECLINQNLLDNLVQSQNYLDWIPGNYSQFWGKTLQAGQDGKLGTESILVRFFLLRYPQKIGIFFLDKNSIQKKLPFLFML